MTSGRAYPLRMGPDRSVGDAGPATPPDQCPVGRWCGVGRSARSAHPFSPGRTRALWNWMHGTENRDRGVDVSHDPPGSCRQTPIPGPLRYDGERGGGPGTHTNVGPGSPRLERQPRCSPLYVGAGRRPVRRRPSSKRAPTPPAAAVTMGGDSARRPRSGGRRLHTGSAQWPLACTCPVREAPSSHGAVHGHCSSAGASTAPCAAARAVLAAMSVRPGLRYTTVGLRYLAALPGSASVPHRATDRDRTVAVDDPGRPLQGSEHPAEHLPGLTTHPSGPAHGRRAPVAAVHRCRACQLAGLIAPDGRCGPVALDDHLDRY